MRLGNWFGRTDPGRSAAIVDPGLRRRSGHPFHAAVAVRRAAKAADLATLVLASKACARDIAVELDAKRCFSRALYSREDWSFAGYEAEAKRCEKEIARQLRFGGRSIDAVVLPTCDQTQLRALADLISRGFLPSGLPLLGWLLFPPRWNAASDARADAGQIDEYRDAVDRIASANRDRARLWICCETEDLRALYETATGIDVRLCAGPSTPERESIAAPPATTGGGCHFVVAGHATSAKGYDLLPEAIRATIASTPAATFTIHGFAEDGRNPEGIDALDRLASMGPRVTVFSHQLATDEYYRLLGSADVLLLPYRLPDYGQRGSGIFAESTRLGIPVVAPTAAGFARQAIAEGRAIGMTEHTSAALTESIAEALRSLESLKRKCRAFLADAPAALTPAAVLADFFRLAAAGIGYRN